MNFLTLLLIAIILVIITKPTKPKSQSNMNINSNNPRYIIYGSMKCGYTLKLLDHLKEINRMHEFIYKDANGDKNYESLNVQGVPCIYCMKTGKFVVGFHTYEDLRKKL